VVTACLGPGHWEGGQRTERIASFCPEARNRPVARFTCRWSRKEHVAIHNRSAAKLPEGRDRRTIILWPDVLARAAVRGFQRAARETLRARPAPYGTGGQVA